MGKYPVLRTEYRVSSHPASLWLGTRYSQLFIFRRQCQPEHRNHSLPGDIDFRFLGIRQIKRLAVLAAVDFCVRSPGFFRVAAGLLDHVLRVKPALQMSATEFAFFVFLVTGALSRLLGLDLMMRKLRSSLRTGSRDFASCQRTYPRSPRRSRRRIRSYQGHCTRSPEASPSHRQTVKVISRLQLALPEGYEYRMIFMQRPLP